VTAAPKPGGTHMVRELPASAQKVQDALDRTGVSWRVVAMLFTARTAQEAADAIACEVGQIGKSIVFRGLRSGKPILVIASGVNRIIERTMQHLAGEPVARPDAQFVRETIGLAIGGIPPLGFPRPIETWIDSDLLPFAEVWTAAATQSMVFSVNPASLAAITGGTVTRVV
jgi:prolyl-tRNA editing enzyme YbaK/EbsC (Cys-tRNA(Pro) deacylase)